MTKALEGGEGSASRIGRSLPPGKTRYPLYRRLGGPQGRSGQVRKISPTPGFEPRTVQPVASRYTEYATQRIAIRMCLCTYFTRERAGYCPKHCSTTHLAVKPTNKNDVQEKTTKLIKLEYQLPRGPECFAFPFPI